jgi:hypothetical protein
LLITSLKTACVIQNDIANIAFSKHIWRRVFLVERSSGVIREFDHMKSQSKWPAITAGGLIDHHRIFRSRTEFGREECYAMSPHDFGSDLRHIGGTIHSRGRLARLAHFI